MLLQRKYCNSTFLFTFFLWKSVYKSFGVFVRHEYHKSHEEQQACRNNDSDDIVNGIFSLQCPRKYRAELIDNERYGVCKSELICHCKQDPFDIIHFFFDCTDNRKIRYAEQIEYHKADRTQRSKGLKIAFTDDRGNIFFSEKPDESTHRGVGISKPQR